VDTLSLSRLSGLPKLARSFTFSTAKALATSESFALHANEREKEGKSY
jgi:hypothetical protein